MTYSVLKTDGNPQAAIRSVLRDLLSTRLADAIMVAARTPYSALPMPALCSDPDKLEAADPLAPVAPFNAARQAASLLRRDAGRRVAVVLRPCELRALVELAKLRQCTLENSFLIGFDCLGRMENSVYLETLKEAPDLTTTFYNPTGIRTGPQRPAGPASPFSRPWRIWPSACWDMNRPTTWGWRR